MQFDSPARGCEARASGPLGQALRGFKPGVCGSSHAPGPRQAAGPRCPRTIRPLQSAALPLRVLSRPVLKHGPRSLTCARVTGIY